MKSFGVATALAASVLLLSSPSASASSCDSESGAALCSGLQGEVYDTFYESIVEQSDGSRTTYLVTAVHAAEQPELFQPGERVELPTTAVSHVGERWLLSARAELPRDITRRGLLRGGDVFVADNATMPLGDAMNAAASGYCPMLVSLSPKERCNKPPVAACSTSGAGAPFVWSALVLSLAALGVRARKNPRLNS